MADMAADATGRRLLLAAVALFIADLIGVVLAVSSGATEGDKAWGFDILGYVPLPMATAELVLAWLAARNVRPPLGRVAAILLSLICLVSVLAGLFDGDITNDALSAGLVVWGGVLIVLTAVVGILAVSRARQLRRR